MSKDNHETLAVFHCNPRPVSFYLPLLASCTFHPDRKNRNSHPLLPRFLPRLTPGDTQRVTESPARALMTNDSIGRLKDLRIVSQTVKLRYSTPCPS